MNAEQIAKALSTDAHREGAWWRCKCPAHHGRSNNSLALRDDSQKGRPVIQCHAACDWRDVVKALRECGLWPKEDGTFKRTSSSPSKPKPKPLPPGPAGTRAEKWQSLA